MAVPRPHPRRLTDAELVAACRSAEAWAWHEMVRRYRRVVYGVPRLYRLQPADADEVFQRTFAGLLQALAGLRRPERIESWLVTTAKRHCIQVLREGRRDIRLAQAAAALGDAGTAPDPAWELEQLRQGEDLVRLVEAMSEPCRGLIVALFASAPRSYRQAAKELRLPVGSIGPMRSRCLDRLRVDLLRQRRSRPLPTAPRRMP